MKTNIYSIFVTTSRSEYMYFIKNILKCLPETNYKLIHLHYNSNRTDKKLLHFTVYPRQAIKIDIVSIFKTLPPSDKNVFVYSGHSDGINMNRVFRIDDFCEIISKTLDNRKADLVIFDSCLMGSIQCLYMCRHVAKYVMASPTYYDYASVLETKSIWKPIVNGCRIIDEYCKLVNSKVFTNIVMYKMNTNLDKYISLLLKNLPTMKLVSCLPNYSYYKDVSNRSFVKYQGLCNPGSNRITSLIIVLKKPLKNYLPSKSDIFMRTGTPSASS